MKYLPWVFACVAASPSFHAQGSGCSPSWVPTFSAPGMNHRIFAFAVGDLGDGTALFAGGQFTRAGGQRANRVARWDGASWSSLGAGIGLDTEDTSVRALTIFDDGSGPALHAGGAFTSASGVATSRIARWDGFEWTPLGAGVGGDVLALAVFDDGGGPALYAGGAFTTAGGASANRLAKWDGSTWSPLGSGSNGVVTSLAVFDDGSGPALYAGGGFTTAGGVSANRVARWNGTSWSPLGSGTNDFVSALAVFDDGSGDALCVAGTFTTAGGASANRIAKWNGSTWARLSSGMDNSVLALGVFDAGSGPALFAGGTFSSAGSTAAARIARWNGTSWGALGAGVDGAVEALAVFDDGAGPKLHVGGPFSSAGPLEANGVAAWDGAWSNLDVGPENEIGSVAALELFDDGTGTALYAGGGFTRAGSVTANRVARWDGASWAPLGSGTNQPPLGAGVRALEVYDDGSGGGPALFVGGDFTIAGGTSASCAARWNGSSWAPLGSGLGQPFPSGFGAPAAVHALAVFDDGSGSGPELHAGGNFTLAGGLVAPAVARWNGLAWSRLESSVLDALAGPVLALAVLDTGSGPVLYAGGSFLTTAGGVALYHVARWDGDSWSPLAGGTDGDVSALAVFDTGFGPRLYAGGSFTTAGGVTVNGIARWNGAGWAALGSGVDSEFDASVLSLVVLDDGAGSALYAGGDFTAAGGVAANGIARWDGAGWSPLGRGIRGQVRALGPWNGAGGPTLFAGGSFHSAYDSLDRSLARWQGCDTAPPVLDCPADFIVRDTGAPGETVTFSVSASDANDPAPAVVCTPPSGSFFQHGITRVTCTATDASGNQSSCSFEVFVGMKVRRR